MEGFIHGPPPPYNIVTFTQEELNSLGGDAMMRGWEDLTASNQKPCLITWKWINNVASSKRTGS